MKLEHIKPIGQTSCVDADKGHYVSSAGSTSQDACVAGTYQDQAGQSECKVTESGNYNAQNGAVSMTPCPAGTFNPVAGSVSSDACAPSEAGYYSERSSEQIECPAGTYQSSLQHQL